MPSDLTAIIAADNSTVGTSVCPPYKNRQSHKCPCNNSVSSPVGRASTDALRSYGDDYV